MHTFLLRCPQCKNQMKYQTQTKILSGKYKQCVYCGRNFAAKNNLLKQLA